MSESPKRRTALRVSKYGPNLRDERGAFSGEDWTSVSDVGSAFNGKPLTLDDYLEVEARYLRVVAAFLTDAGVERTTSVAVEAFDDARWWPAEGESLSLLESTDVVRGMLREQGFCRLEASHGVYVHVGYDYYLYLGGNVACARTLRAATDAGLNVDEQFTSPYHADPRTGGYF
jgi:hypothetical protein